MNKKFHFDTLSIAITNIILCSFVIPYLISMILNSMNLSFLHLVLVGWIPGGLGAAYVLYRFFKQSKMGNYPIFKGVIAALLSLMMLIFAVMMVFSGAVNFYNIHQTVGLIEEKYEPVSLVVHIDEADYYFENNDGKYYCYHVEEDIFEENDQYQKEMEKIRQEIKLDDDGSYYIVK